MLTEALTRALMHSTQPMVLTDPNVDDHPMIAINPAFEALSGYSAAETLGRNCRFLQGANTDRATAARIRGHIAARRGCVEWIVNYRRDGRMFWNLLFLSPVFDSNGTLLHYFGNQRDISEGPPADLPDYTLGRAQILPEGQCAFHALLLDKLDEAADGESSARTLEALVETARRLDMITTGLSPIPWSPT